jgi:hypothetical protein
MTKGRTYLRRGGSRGSGYASCRGASSALGSGGSVQSGRTCSLPYNLVPGLVDSGAFEEYHRPPPGATAAGCEHVQAHVLYSRTCARRLRRHRRVARPSHRWEQRSRVRRVGSSLSRSAARVPAPAFRDRAQKHLVRGHDHGPYRGRPPGVANPHDPRSPRAFGRPRICRSRSTWSGQRGRRRGPTPAGVWDVFPGFERRRAGSPSGHDQSDVAAAGGVGAATRNMARSMTAAPH